MAHIWDRPYGVHILFQYGVAPICAMCESCVIAHIKAICGATYVSNIDETNIGPYESSCICAPCDIYVSLIYK
jgi:hypothetical protein